MLAVLLVLVSVPGQRRARAGDYAFGSDRDPVATDAVLAAVRPDLVPILTSDNRTGFPLAKAFIRKHPGAVVEVLKRFRNPELWRLFVSLRDHRDWRVRHRAVFALGKIRHPEAYKYASFALGDDDPRVRVRAAISCIETWDTQQKTWPSDVADVESRSLFERDPRVLGALRALQAVARGELAPQVVQKEPVVELDDGLLFVPFVRGWENLDPRTVGARPESFRRSSSRRGTDAEVGEAWFDPVFDFAAGAFQDSSIETFGQSLQGVDGLHAGVDVAAGMDGAGVFAIGAGVVRAIRAGGPEGTVIAVQYHLGDRRLVNAVHMHCGGTVFVKCGDVVEPGQLLGSVGMAYSMSNGGRVAHLHFGLHPPETAERPPLVARVPKSELYCWYDPLWYQARWRVVRSPVVSHFTPDRPALADAYEELENGRYARASTAALRLARDKKLPVDVRTAAQKLADRIAQAVADAAARVHARAPEIRRMGYPWAALDLLRQFNDGAEGMTGLASVTELLDEWKTDGSFQRELEAERRVVAVHRAAVGRAGQDDAAKAAERDYVALLEEFGDTPLRARIEMLIRGCRTD